MRSLPVLTVQESKSLDREAREVFGLSEDVLIENAGRSCVELLIKEKLISFEDCILVLVGGGSNGSDGLVVARVLHGLGFNCKVIEFQSPKSVNLNRRLREIYIRCGGTHVLIDQAKMGHLRDQINVFLPNIIIDCVTGTGFKGALRENVRSLVEFISQLRLLGRLQVFSIDIPSFNDGDLGLEPMGFSADFTLSIQTLKKIHVEPSAASVVGRVFLLDVGIPLTPQFEKVQVLGSRMAAEISKKVFHQAPNIHKGNRPKVLVVGGCLGKEGAGVLASIGALRAGASLVTLVSNSANVLETMPPEIMFTKVDKGVDLKKIRELVSQKDSVVLGPGLGKENIDLFQLVFESCVLESKPLVIDADGIGIFADHFGKVGIKLPKRLVLTPHPKEFLSLMPGVSMEEVNLRRFDFIRQCSGKYGATVVLKGARSLVSHEDRIFVDPHMEPLMAVGGSGDVLSGVLAALIPRSDSLGSAVPLGVFLHAAAGVNLRNKFKEGVGALASEIADAIPKIIDQLGELEINISNICSCEPFLQ